MLYSLFTGFGVALFLAKCFRVDRELRRPSAKILQIFLSIVATLSLEAYKIPHQNEAVFYAGGFLKFYTMTNIVTVVITYCLQKFFNPVERIKDS